MPISKRPSRRPRIGAELSQGVRTLLETGFSMYWRLENRALLVEPPADEVQGLWRLHGGTVTAEWIAAHPGSRPWAWWAYDAPERRLCSNGTHPFDDPSRNEYVAETDKQFPGFAEAAMRLCFGEPACGVPECHDENLEYESEPDYLTRLGLWAPGEREKWAAVPKGTCDACFQ